MNTKEIGVTKDMGFTAYEIAGYLLKKNHLDMADEHYTFTLEKWIIDNNSNNYRFAEGKTIKVPNEENDIVLCVFGHFKICSDGVSRIQRHDGWRLTINGKLVRGKSGWLRDENGLYILKDGRRLNGGHNECIDALKRGKEEIWSGLDDILGASSEKLNKEEDDYNTGELLRLYGPHMPEVVYQAFQINIGYKLLKEKGTIINNSSAWEPCTRNPPNMSVSFPNCSFGVIGRDETDIPIIVTRIGNANAPNKLVIAGPHGDERNAQRVIMTSQKYFIHRRVPVGIVLYFIPCLSPTTAFADVRGIPNKFWEGGDPDAAMTNGPFQLKTLNIPTLHDEVTYPMRENIRLRNVSQINPRYGVDTNRDYHFSLPSSQMFADFIRHITGIDVRAPVGPKYDGSCAFLMMHGYDSSKAQGEHPDRGCVYGQYTVDAKSDEGTIPLIIKKYTDFMTQSLFGYVNHASTNENNNIEYFFLRDNKGSSYTGEWVRHLYGETGNCNILAFDIELGNTYRQGTRPNYDSNMVGKLTLPFFENASGFFVRESLRRARTGIFPITTFYEFLLKFHENKETVDNTYLNE